MAITLSNSSPLILMTIDHSKIDARRFIRAQAELRVKIIYRRKEVLQMANGRAHDLSEGGVAVYVPLELSMGETLELEFVLPRARVPFRIPATVRNRMGFRYGVEFMVISKVQREEITKFVEQWHPAPLS